MKQTEADIQKAIIEALLWDGWMIIRVNQGGRHVPVDVLVGTGPRYVRFAYWQTLGIDQQDSGISDVIALKDIFHESFGMQVYAPRFLAVEVKATGKAKKLKTAMLYSEHHMAYKLLNKREKHQALFLWSIEEHGGTAVVADRLEDIELYLDRVNVE